MFKHPSIKISILFLAALLASCEHNERESTERLVFNVEAGTDLRDFSTYLSPQGVYQIAAPGIAFYNPDSVSPVIDSTLIPTRLVIKVNQVEDLVPSLLRALGYKATTRFEFEESSISVIHTNLADSLYAVPGDSLGDTLYIAIRGEGLISDGENIFENVTGFFLEQSTYQIVQNSVTKISCRYELNVEY